MRTAPGRSSCQRSARRGRSHMTITATPVWNARVKNTPRMPRRPSSARSQARAAESNVTARTRPLKMSTAQSGLRRRGGGRPQASAYATWRARTKPSENQTRRTSPVSRRIHLFSWLASSALDALATEAAPMPNSLAASSTLPSFASSQKPRICAPTRPLGSSQRKSRYASPPASSPPPKPSSRWKATKPASTPGTRPLAFRLSSAARCESVTRRSRRGAPGSAMPEIL
jgi:hypothetical protein